MAHQFFNTQLTSFGHDIYKTDPRLFDLFHTAWSNSRMVQKIINENWDLNIFQNEIVKSHILYY